VKDEDTSTSLELFETSNMQEDRSQPRKVETCSTGSATSSSKPRRLPRRWMPTMSPRTKSGPTLAMSLVWECRDARASTELAMELEEMLRASTRFAVNLPGWQVYWQLSVDPKAMYRLGLLLWMEPESPDPR